MKASLIVISLCNIIHRVCIDLIEMKKKKERKTRNRCLQSKNDNIREKKSPSKFLRISMSYKFLYALNENRLNFIHINEQLKIGTAIIDE